MKRESRDRRPYLKPVIKAELSEEHFWGRFVIVIILIAVGAVFISRGVLSLVNGETGIREIACRDNDTQLSGDLKFKYNIGEAGVSASVEYKRLVSLYTDACTSAYGYFVSELGSLNNSINEKIRISSELYSVLKELDNTFFLFLEPIYEQYRTLFACQYDYEAVNFDPYENEELKKHYSEVCTFIKRGDISLKLLEDNIVYLYVSDAYADYAEELGITDYIGFGPLFEAVVVDYVSSQIKGNGFKNGVIASYDGFSADLNGNNTVYFYNKVSPRSCYVYSDGTTRTRYISSSDGLCKVLEEDFSITSEDSCLKTYLSYLK